MLIPEDTLFLFILSSGALALAPGPDNLFVLTQSALHGRRAGLLVTLGLCTGLFVHTAAVAVGVAAILAASSVAFAFLKLAGAAYLIYLGWCALRTDGQAIRFGHETALSRGQLYRRGIIMNITNPKVAIFFLAFLPQFTDSSHGPVTLQILALGMAFMATTLIVFGAIAWFSGLVGERLRSFPAIQIAINRIAGIIFLGLAARLLVAER